MAALFWIATSNFVFPVLLSIVQLSLLFACVDIRLALYMQEVNMYFAIIGVAFATVWKFGVAWSDERVVSQSEVHSRIEFRAPTSTGSSCGPTTNGIAGCSEPQDAGIDSAIRIKSSSYQTETDSSIRVTELDVFGRGDSTSSGSREFRDVRSSAE